MDFGFGEKVLVILHGLPVLDHRVYLLVVFALCVGHRCLLTTRGAFGDWRKWSPNASAHFRLNVNSFFENLIFFSGTWRKGKKKDLKKSRNSDFKSFRDRSKTELEDIGVLVEVCKI